ncbi:MAG: hypothetical protein WCK98_05460 [bacterium]
MSQPKIKKIINKKTRTWLLAGVLIVLGFGLGYSLVSNLTHKNGTALAGLTPQQFGAGCPYGVGTYGTGDCGVVEIKNLDIGTSTDCTNAKTVTISATSTYTCTFPLIGASTSVTFGTPTNGIKATTSTNGSAAADLTAISGGLSPLCTIITNTTATASLSCSGIPTSGGTAGLRNVLLSIDNATPLVDKGNVTLQDPAPTTTDPLFIDPSKITFSPIESAAVKFGSADLTLTVGGGNAGALNDPRFTANSTTATCKFRLKEYGVLDSDTTSKGFDLSTAKLAGSVADLDLTNNSFDVAYSATTGCSVKLPLGAAQNQPKWFFEIRVVRSDGQVFGQNMSYFMTYGAIGGVAVS